MQHYTWEGKERQRQGNERRSRVFASIEDNLLFLLYYLKLNPLQNALATTFGLNQTRPGGGWNCCG